MPKRSKLKESSSGIINEAGVEVIGLTASYATNSGRRAMIMDGAEPCVAEEYACRYFKRLGYTATRLENPPIHVLFATLMWPVIQDPSDRRRRMIGFADRQAYDAGIQAKLIWFRMPTDFGKPEYAMRRAEHINRHMAILAAERRDLRLLFDQGLGPSSDLRNYLWAHRPDHIEVARQLLGVMPADTLLEVLGYLIEHYWGRRAGWPDLLVYRRKKFILVEVKSARDKLGAAQQRWIRDNHERLHLPFRLVKIAARPGGCDLIPTAPRN